MARSSDPIIAYIEVLYANRELVSRVYHEGSIADAADVNKGVRALEHAGAIRPFEAGTFKLTRTLQRHFDAATSRLRSYDRLARIAPQLERLKRLKQSMSEARRLGELRDMANAESEFEDECFSIHEAIQRNVFTLRALMDSQFATAKSLQEKKRQNQFYINETRDLQEDVLGLIATQLPFHLVDDEMFELARIYNKMISQHQQAWVVQLAEIIYTIQGMLYKTREVHKLNANLAKALLLFQLHPRFEGPDIPVDDTSPPWLLKVAPVRVRPNPDVRLGGTIYDLGSVAATLAAGPERVAKAEDFVPQQVIDDGEPSSEIVALDPDLYDIALHQFLIDVAASNDRHGVSAYLWKFNRREFDDLSMEVWLQCLLIEEYGQEMETFLLVPVFAPQQDDASGTLVFSDVSVTWRATPQ